MRWKTDKKFLVFEIIAFKFVAKNSPYLSFDVNELTNSPKISDLAYSYFFQLNLCNINGKIV